ncbi:MAG TPA: signal peptidase II [Anaeromyxobacter sp.]|nr:signal peptidase II [Anaeromyxobacter sp.]
MRRRLGKWTVLSVLFVALVLCDQGTKFLAVDRLTDAFERRGEAALFQKLHGFYVHRFLTPHRDPYRVAPFWQMTYAENPGAAWGLFRDLSSRVRNAFFILISLAAVVFILHYYRRLREGQRYYQVALALLLAGAVGNFIDRLTRQYVIDFIDWYAGSYHWPTFNLADSLIVVGVAMLLVHPGQRRGGEASGGPRGADPAGRRGL